MIATAWLLLVHAAADAAVLADEVIEGPEPEDVKAGWTAFALFGLLALAVAVLGRSLVVHLRRAQRAADEGVYGASDDARSGSPSGLGNGPASGPDEGPPSGTRSGAESGAGGGPDGGPDTPDGDHPAT